MNSLRGSSVGPRALIGGRAHRSPWSAQPIGIRRYQPSQRCLRHTPRADIGGQYGEDPNALWNDIEENLLKYLTFKATKNVLEQIYETDFSPGKGRYRWLHDFSADNKPHTGDEFLSKLLLAHRDYGVRIILQRQILYQRFLKVWDPNEANKRIESRNTSLLRENLMQTMSLDTVADHPVDFLRSEDQAADDRSTSF